MTKRLRVSHIPQVPGIAFYVPVETPLEGMKVMNILADYDLFQYQNKIKPDYSNASSLEIDEDFNEWVDWYDTEGNSLDDYELTKAGMVLKS